MSEWEQRITQHRVWDDMRALGPIIDSAVAADGIDTQAVFGLERIRVVLAFSGKRLAGADPLTVVPGTLDGLATAFVTAKAEIEAFLADRDATHVQNANRQVDIGLGDATQIPALSSPEELGALVASANQYRKLVEENLLSFNRFIDTTRTATEIANDKLNELRSEIQVEAQRLSQLAAEQAENLRIKLSEAATLIQSEQQRLSQVVSDHQRQFSESQEKRSQEFTEALRNSQQQLAQITSEHQGQFSTAQDSRSREFSETQTSRQGKFDGVISEYNQRLADQNADFTRQKENLTREFQEGLTLLKADYAQKADAIVKSIEEHRVHVEKLVGVIGNLGVTSGYQKTANQARHTMWLWQAIAVGAMAGLIFFAYYTLPLLEDKSGLFRWGGFAGRVFLSLTFGVLAAYAASQADKLFEVEKRNRKLALELEAIGPYLAPLPQEEQDKFRVQIGGRSFGRDEPASGKQTGKSPATVLDLLSDLLSSEGGRQLLQTLGDVARKERPG